MLYVIGTPLGNLGDLSQRAKDTLAASDIVLAEDTRTAQNLFKDEGHKPQIISYFKDNEFQKLPEIMVLLRQDKTISLISESGMPLVSDPGYLLVKQVIKEKIPFTVIPGPTAATTALIYSGFNPSSFMFLGFLPKKESEIKKELDMITSIQSFTDSQIAFIFYESPHRINKTLEILAEVVPEADIVVARELTKKFEEIIRGKPKDLKVKIFKGELTLVIQLQKISNK